MIHGLHRRCFRHSGRIYRLISRDEIKLSLKDIKSNPSNYILTSAMAAHIERPAVEIPPVVRPAPKPVKAMERVEFGNMDFPTCGYIY